MSDHSHHGAAPDYTQPFLVSFFVFIFIGLFAVLNIWGLIGVAIVSWVADRCITLGARARGMD